MDSLVRFSGPMLSILLLPCQRSVHSRSASCLLRAQSLPSPPGLGRRPARVVDPERRRSAGDDVAAIDEQAA